MASHTRFVSLGLTVGMWLMVRDTVAIDTCASLATAWMSMRSGFEAERRLVRLAGPAMDVPKNAFTAYSNIDILA
jgi:hypothetical protein